MVFKLSNCYIQTKNHLNGNRIENILWFVNIVPNLLGFSLERDEVFVPFWIGTALILIYVYGVGSIVYQAKFARVPSDFVKNYFNVSILIFVLTNCYWWIKQRPLLKTVLKQVTKNDKSSRETDCLLKKHENLLSVVKKIVLIFNGCNMISAIFIYLPHRIDVSNNYYSMTPCVGLEPLTASPNREICLIILTLPECCIITIMLTFQSLILFLIAHTSTMYELLSAEMLLLDKQNYDQFHYNEVKENLPKLINRHILTLDIIKNLQDLYGMPTGVNFGTNAVCIALFFYLSLQECINFSPIFINSFLVFFLYCYLCQKLIDSSQSFERSVYACGWEKFDVREKRMVYIILLQAQKPVKLLAANIIPVNIYTFATTLQLLYKFLTVVKF
ncbi:odorant receptor 49b-like [Pieris rapae]|uniref:odorant receptor 49b-like n=1 Tax=Pieris rapae TaxID=64459 RepID=UPI001E27D10E|nr:odorant receptor 49b-like [Pieris rapae]